VKQSEWIPKKIIASSFGGAMTKSNPKGARPFSSSLAVHVVFKSSLAKGGLSFFRHKKFFNHLIKRQSELHRIQIHAWQIVGKHVHFVIRAKRRRSLQAFMRAFSGISARYFLKAERGKPKGKTFWDYRPFSTLVDLDLKTKKYLALNRQNLFEDYLEKKANILLSMNRLLLRLLAPG